MDTGLHVPGSGSGSRTANKKRKVVTSKVSNNNNGHQPIMGVCADPSEQQDFAADVRLLRELPRMPPQRLF